ncbi:glycosyltransferase family 2 protein [Planococcus sp. YIM B11945]|uniref:glycosyltransferase family 2 protein n=1 Tax=Planococcus sp. YIM B11945 TaxID=3435410 RepID=UPI003D7DD640
MEEKQLVSIIVPVYNAEKYISQCVESILSQTYGHIELLLIDDGSTDSSGKVCKEFAARDPRVNVIHQPNAGPSAARNRGIAEASGTFIQFVDSDDSIDPEMTETMVNALAPDEQLVICGYKNMLEIDGKPVPEKSFSFSKAGSYEKAELLAYFGELYRDYFIHFNWNKLYSASLLKTHHLSFDTEVIRGEDMLFNLSYLELCSRIRIIKEPFYNYLNSNSESITSTFRPNLFENQQMLFEKTREFLREHGVYSGENKEYVEEFYTSRIVACFNNLFHPYSTLTHRQVNTHILKIMWDERVSEKLEYFFKGTIEKKLLGYAIVKQLVEAIYWYFYVKSWIRKKMNAIGKKSKKWI